MKIEALGILTCQRAELLARCLALARVHRRSELQPWAIVVREAAAVMDVAMRRREFLVPVELEARGIAGAMHDTAALVRQFGELTEAWPALVHAARALRAEGRRPSRPLSRAKSPELLQVASAISLTRGSRNTYDW